MLFVATKKHRIYTVHLPATKLLYNNFGTAAFVFKIYEQQIPPIKLLLPVLYNLRQKASAIFDKSTYVSFPLPRFQDITLRWPSSNGQGVSVKKADKKPIL